jgi:oligopeptide/dipeptide ABC transporter ATP-binding protein
MACATHSIRGCDSPDVKSVIEAADNESPLLAVSHLTTHFHLDSGVLKAVDDVSFSLAAGRTTCIVGESGSGKSVTALSIMRLIEPPGRIVSGSIQYGGIDLLGLPEGELESRIRGNRIGMIFQDPMTSLNPLLTIGSQVSEGIILHRGLTRSQARRQAVEVLKLVGIPDAAERFDSYPHQFSGGMRQRVMIAAAIACEPDLLIADEPTTALDVTIQAQILRLLSDIRERLSSSLLLITHDLGVVSAMADEVLVMYAGKIVERSTITQLFEAPAHPYTEGLLKSVVRLDDPSQSPFDPIPGAPLVPLNPQAGCHFRTRCKYAFDRCDADHPPLFPVAADHDAACYLRDERP